MKYKHLGELLYELRTMCKLTQAEASEGVCTVRQYGRLEKGEYYPRMDILNGLSRKFNINLFNYFEFYFSNESVAAIKCKVEFNRILENSLTEELPIIIEEIKQHLDFTIRENCQMLLFAKGVHTFCFEEDYEKSAELCMEALNLDKKDIINLKKNRHLLYNNVELATWNCLGSCYGALDKKEEAIEIFSSIKEVIEARINEFDDIKLVSPYEKKIYEIVLYNLGSSYMKNAMLEPALEMTEMGIHFSILHNHIRFLPNLMVRKFELLCMSNEREKAEEAYKTVFELLKLVNINNKYEKQVQKLEKLRLEYFNNKK